MRKRQRRRDGDKKSFAPGKNLNRHHAPPLRNTGKRVIRRHRAARTLANVTTPRTQRARTLGETLICTVRDCVRSIDRPIDSTHVSPPRSVTAGKERFATLTEARPYPLSADLRSLLSSSYHSKDVRMYLRLPVSPSVCPS